MSKVLTTIGRAEKIALPDILGKDIFVVAKVDTGADLSSLWVSGIRATAEGLEFSLFGPGSPHYTGDRVLVHSNKFRLTRVVNSFGHREERYVIKSPIIVKGRRVLTTFTLADRSSKVYPILLGRSLLNGKFVVNVAQGEPLVKAKLMRKEPQDR